MMEEWKEKKSSRKTWRKEIEDEEEVALFLLSADAFANWRMNHKKSADDAG